MTTIATNGKSIAADGRLSAGGRIIKEDDDKIRKVYVEHCNEQLLIGLCGPISYMEDLIEFITTTYQGNGTFLRTRFAMKDYDTGHSHPNEMQALVLTQGGMVFVASWNEPITECSKVQGLGSGGDIAVGAMLAGKTPGEAVLIASKVDSNTNANVTEIKLG